jgi:hypothetical protein
MKTFKNESEARNYARELYKTCLNDVAVIKKNGEFLVKEVEPGERITENFILVLEK